MAETLIDQQLLTADEFWAQYEGKRYELVKGVPVAMSPTGGSHQVIAANCVRLLGNFVVEHPIGYVGSSEGGYRLTRNPDILRAPDASFISFKRLSGHSLPDAFFPLAPDLAVEIVSPDDRAAEIAQKVNEYLTYGTRLVWIIYPKQQEVMVYRPGGAAQVLSSDDRLDGGDVLPGFSISIRELWPIVPPTEPM